MKTFSFVYSPPSLPVLVSDGDGDETKCPSFSNDAAKIQLKQILSSPQVNFFLKRE